MAQRIILVGYMGAGKTTVGHALSKLTGMPFYDLDWYIETRMHRKVPQLFAEWGEEKFRQMEHNMLHEVAEFDQVILSCGGGTPCFFDNMDYMNQQGETIYLKASPEVLYSHLCVARVERPLLKNMSQEQLQEHIRHQLEVREPYYMKAKHIVDVNQQTDFTHIKTTVAKIRERLGI